MNFRPAGPIPGAFEPRHGHAGTRETAATSAFVTHAAHDTPIHDREQLVREYEGGGAPSERTGRRSVLTRLFDFVLR